MKNELKQLLSEYSGDYVKYAITDIDGILRAKYVHKTKLLNSIESGVGFCNVIFGWDAEDKVYANNTFTGWQTGFPDVPVFIDDSTFRVIPWEDDMPFFLADLKGKHAVCPRSLLQKQVDKAKNMGFTPHFSQEFEWFNFFKEEGKLTPATEGMFGYSQIRTAQHTEYCQELLNSLQAFNVPLEGLHTETGPGVYEAALAYSDAVVAADRAVLFKSAVKKISFEYGMQASFMAKWNTALPGCSGHIHQNLMKGEENVFFDANDPMQMSPTMQHYLAGQLSLLPELMPLLLPTVNSYKRLVEGSWAPVNMTWGIENRTAALRVINMKDTNTRLETRVPGADSNPYLVMAACLAAGLYGIEHQLALKDKPITGNAYDERRAKRLPTNLAEATKILKKSKRAAELLGKEFVDYYVNTRELEWKEYEQSVSDWELNRYGEII